MVDTEVACYGWMTPNAEPMDDLGVSFTPPRGDVWLYDFATVPEFRGRRFYPALLRFILADLQEQGYQRAWIGTEPGNLASQAGIRRAGFTFAAEMRFVGRPGQGHFIVHRVPDTPDALLHDAVRTLHGRLEE